MKPNPDIKQEADRCVMCGLCLPHCPTYLKTQNENESPRGRISLMRALATGELELSDKVRDHLDNCLLCRACEVVCPSQVNYSHLMDMSRIDIAAERPPVQEQRISLDALATDKQRRRRDATFFWLLESSGLRALGRAFGITKAVGLERLEQLAPKLRRPHGWKSYYPATGEKPSGEKQGDVALFTGCFSDMFDQQTLDAAVKLLNRLGYGVHVPETQTCCGALHWHKGDEKTARQLAAQNIETFADLDVEAIISTASGCGSHLSEYEQFGGEASIGQRVTDISEFLSLIEWPEEIQFKPLPQRVAVHEPCSLRNSLKAAAFVYQLLAKIPALEIIALPGNERCCGSAGSYMLDHPQMADSLRQDKIEALKQTGATLLATSNIGCAMHLTAGIRCERLNIETLHPVTLLARQLS